MRFAPIVISVLILAGCAASQVNEPTTPVDTPTLTEASTDVLQPTSTLRDEPSPAVSLTSTPESVWSGCPISIPKPLEGAARVIYIGGNGNLYRQDDGDPLQQLTDSGDAVEAQLSTDGSLIAYERNPSGFPPELWVIGADGSNSHRVLGEPSIEALNPEITQAPLNYWLNFRWIPYHNELIIEARVYQTEPGFGEFFAVYRLDPEQLSLDRFPGPWEASFSPDGTWFAMPEDNSLSLISTDNTQAYHKVLEGYDFIGITSFSVLPPLGWFPDGVHLIVPSQDDPDTDPRVPPFEIWAVPFGGTPAQVGMIEGDHSPLINFIFFAPNSQYFVFQDDNKYIVLSEVGGETHQLGTGPLGYEVWWNPTSTHFLHRSEGLRLDDICGNSSHTLLEGEWGESSPSLEIRWLDPTRALIMRHGLTNDEGVTPLGSVYLFSATDSSLSLIADDVQDADATLIR